MCNFFKLKQETLIENYIRIKEFPLSIDRNAVLKSEFQHLDSTPITLEVSGDAGVEFPDFLEQDGYVLLSNTFKEFLEEFARTTCFFSRIIIEDELMGRKELYWLTVVDRITCLSSSSEYDEELSFKYLTKVVLDKNKVGYYDFFKIKEDGDNSIFITKSFKEKIEKKNFNGLNIIKL